MVILVVFPLWREGAAAWRFPTSVVVIDWEVMRMWAVVFKGISRSVTQIPLHRRSPYCRGDEAARAKAGVVLEMRLGDTDLHFVIGALLHVWPRAKRPQN